MSSTSVHLCCLLLYDLVYRPLLLGGVVLVRGLTFLACACAFDGFLL